MKSVVIDKQRPGELAKAHWDYIDEVLVKDGVSLRDRWRIGFHYKQAMIHGYKHALQDIDASIDDLDETCEEISIIFGNGLEKEN